MARGSYALALPIEASYQGRQQNAANRLQINTHLQQGLNRRADPHPFKWATGQRET